MRIGTEDKKKLAILAVAGTVALGCVVFIYYELAMPSTPAPVVVPVASVPAPSRGKAKVSGSEPVLTQLDPTLKMGPMLVTEALVYSGGGRNIFSATSVPVEMPKAIAPARPAPAPAPVFVRQGPPPPPPIDLKFFGTASSKNGARQALLLHGEDVFVASAGDVVQRRYRIVSVAANSIVVEDLTNNNRQTLPLLANP